MTITTIKVTKDTCERLKAIKIAKRESYDEVINRLISEVKIKPITIEQTQEQQPVKVNFNLDSGQ